ncbi:MAG: hypothetical protein ABSF43_01815 [Rectinemataceae bacterium]|jgi:predicted nucleotidyltransferase
MVDPKKVALRIRAQNENERRELELRRSRAQELGHELARDIIHAHPEAGRVWGFGSAFETWRSFRMTSDIDLAVEAGDVSAIWKMVEGRGFPVDVVDLSSCRESMTDFIRAQGVVLAQAGA